MNLFACLAVGLALVCSTLGDGTAAEQPRECTMERGEGVLSANLTAYHKLDDCFFVIGYEHLGSDPSDELILSTFATFCNKTSLLAKCMDKVDEDARECLDADELTRYRLYRQYREMDFEEGCRDNAPIVVNHYRLFDTRNITDNFIANCETEVISRLGEMEADGPNRFMLYKYAVLGKMAECMGAHRGGDNDALVNWVIAMCASERAAMRCIDQGGNQVLCKTLVVEPTESPLPLR